MIWHRVRNRTAHRRLHPCLRAGWAGDRLLVTLPGIDHQILLLRWLALLIVIVLHWFDRSVAGVILPVPEMTLVVVGYNIILLLLMRYVRWCCWRPCEDRLVAGLVTARWMLQISSDEPSLFLLPRPSFLRRRFERLRGRQYARRGDRPRLPRVG